MGPLIHLFLYFWWRLPWIWIPHLCSSFPVCNGFLRFTFGAAPADHLAASMAAELLQSAYLHIMLSTSIGGVRTHNRWCCNTTLLTIRPFRFDLTGFNFIFLETFWKPGMWILYRNVRFVLFEKTSHGEITIVRRLLRQQEMQNRVHSVVLHPRPIFQIDASQEQQAVNTLPKIAFVIKVYFKLNYNLCGFLNSRIRILMKTWDIFTCILCKKNSLMRTDICRA